MIEKKVNEYGQLSIINNSEKIIKIEGKLLQVRLIRTTKFSKPNEFTKPMPRARFFRKEECRDPYYLIRKSDFENLKKRANR